MLQPINVCTSESVWLSMDGYDVQGEVVSNHDELMCNFFAQADALANGKTPVELRAENVPDHLIPHKSFTGKSRMHVLFAQWMQGGAGQSYCMRVVQCPFEGQHDFGNFNFL